MTKLERLTEVAGLALGHGEQETSRVAITLLVNELCGEQLLTAIRK